MKSLKEIYDELIRDERTNKIDRKRVNFGIYLYDTDLRQELQAELERLRKEFKDTKSNYKFNLFGKIQLINELLGEEK